MAQTNDFRNLLRKNRREFGLRLGTIKAMEEADVMGIITDRPRKKNSHRFNRQKGTVINDIIFTEF